MSYPHILSVAGFFFSFLSDFIFQEVRKKIVYTLKYTDVCYSNHVQLLIVLADYSWWKSTVSSIKMADVILSQRIEVHELS